MSTPTPQTPLADLRAEEPQNDHIELIRWDLADTARRYRLACPEYVIEHADSPAMWSLVAKDFTVTAARLTTSSHITRPASDAAECMSQGDTSGALSRLADSCGMSVEEWILKTREEMADARR